VPSLGAYERVSPSSSLDPMHMIDSTLSYFGRRPGLEEELIGLRQEDRRNHLLVIGKTNSGKTTLLRNLMAQDILSGRGLCFIDPHGDTAQELLDCIPPERLNEVVYIDPSGERDFPVSLNPLVPVPPDERHLMAERVVGIFRGIWGMTAQNMPRAPRVLYMAVRAQLDLPPRAGASLLGVARMLEDADYRHKVIAHIQDSACRSYWVETIGPREGSDQRSRHELETIFDPIVTRVGSFLQSPELRRVRGAKPRATGTH
jgi:hypothetical protein